MQVYTRYLLLEFVIGMLLARWWLGRGAGLSLSWSAPMLLAGSYLLLTRDVGVLGEYTQVLGAGLTVAGALNPRWVQTHHRLALALGDSSYSTYLTHLFTLGVLRIAWTRLLPEADSALWAWAYMALALTCCHFVGWMAMRCIEQPLLKALR
jgi:exopolysaccharide production protein ExoZ